MRPTNNSKLYDTDAARSVPTAKEIEPITLGRASPLEKTCLIKNYICETDEERIAQKKITSCLVVGV